MSKGEEGGATANVNSSSYGGSGAGGKFRKKLFRRQVTPYDRPSASLRGSSDIPRGWLKKLFVDPAYKLISYGADRLFDSVFRQRLPAPSSSQQPDVKPHTKDADQEPVVNDKEAEPARAESNHPNNVSDPNAISELEQLLMRNTFTRSEIVHLTELLKSKETEVCTRNILKERAEFVSDYRTHQVFGSGSVGENRNDGVRLSASSTPLRQLKAPQDDIPSPADLAKKFMGSKSLKVSPSVLRLQPQILREDSGFSNNGPFAFKSPIVPSIKKKSVNFTAIGNDYATPRSQSRSAIYSMARTPYSRGHSSLKANKNVYTEGAFSPSSFLHLNENGEKYDGQSTSLKRRSSVLEDDIKSVGPIRRIKQKSNLLAASHISHTSLGINSHMKQNSGLMVEQSNKISGNVGENECRNPPSTSYGCVPSRSSKMAAKILQQLEKLSPKEKPSESKFGVGLEKSPLSLANGMLSGQALRSTEAVELPKLLLEFHNEKKLSDMFRKPLPDAHVHLQKTGNDAGNGLEESFYPAGTWNDSIFLKSLKLSTKTADSSLENSTSKPSQKNRASTMSAQEDSLELDDDKNSTCSPGVVEPSSSSNKVLPFEESRPGKMTNQPGFMPPLGLSSSKAHEFGATSASGDIEKTASLLEVPFTVGKTKAAKGSTPVFSFTSKVDDSFRSQPSEFSTQPASYPESSSSLPNTFQLPGSQLKIPELEKYVQPSLAKTGDANGKSESVPLAVNGSFLCSPSSRDFAENPTGNGVRSSNSTGAVDFITSSNSDSFSGSILGLTAMSSSLAGLLPGTATAPLTDKYPKVSGISAKPGLQPSSGSPSWSVSFPALGASSSGNITVGLDSKLSQSTATNLKGSLFGDSSRTLLSAIPPFLPSTSFNVNGTSTLGFSSSSPAFDKSNVFNCSASGSSSVATKELPGQTQSSNAANAESNVATVERTSVISSVGTTGSAVNFGLSPAYSTNAAGSGFVSNTCALTSSMATTDAGIGSNLPIFGFAAGSSGSATINSATSFCSSSSGVFTNGGSSSAATYTNNPVSSNSASLSVFGSSWQAPKSPAFGTTFTSFGASSSSAPSIFNSSAGSASPFTALTASVTSPSLPVSQPIFGKPTVASSGNNDQMNSEDSMAEDPVQSSTPTFPVFGQSSAPQPALGFGFGLTAPSQASPLVFSGQKNQVASLNLSPFQSSGSLEFNAGGGFSVGSGGADKNRRTVRISKIKNRKK